MLMNAMIIVCRNWNPRSQYLYNLR